MHICHINLARGFSGGERQTLTLMERQLDMGYTLSAVAKERSPFALEASRLGCAVTETPHFIFRHAKAITAQCDAMHVHEGQAIYWALIQHLRHKAPYIVTRRVDNPLKDKALLKLAYRKASFVIALSNAIQEEIGKVIPETSVHIIPSSPVRYPHNTSAADALRSHCGPAYMVIQAGKHYSHKGVDLTIQAARLLQGENIQFFLLGDGPESEQLKRMASDLKNVHFLGAQTNMGDWFTAADLLIHPSYSEGLGSVILEALHAGLPVIGTRAGGIPDIIQHEKNGLLIPTGDSAALASAIRRMRDDAELRETISQQTNTLLAPFLIENTAPQYQALYDAAKQGTRS